MRKRTRGTIDLMPIPYQLTTWPFTSTGCTSCATTENVIMGSSSLRIGKSEVMLDTVTPAFHKRIARGEIIFNAMSKTELEYSFVGDGPMVYTSGTSCAGTSCEMKMPIVWAYGALPYFLVNRGQENNLPLLAPPAYSMLQDEVMTKVLSDRKTVADSNLFESVAEVNKTLGSLSKLFDDLRKAINGRSVVKKHLALSGAYLNVRYGIAPVIRDIASIAAELRNGHSGHIRRTTRAAGSLQDSRESLIDVHETTKLSVIWKQVQKSTVSVRAMSIDELYVDLLDRVGLGYHELATVGWELVPYSFVADWVANLGDLVSALAPRPGIISLAAGMTTRIESETSLSMLPNPWQFDDRVPGSAPGVYTLRSSSTSRTPGLAPGFAIRSNFKMSNMTRLADAYSLLSQKVLRLR